MTLPSPVVLDNTVLANFALVESAPLVLELWAPGVCTTAAVMDEYRAGVVAGTVPQGAWSELPVTPLDGKEEAMVAGFPQRLGRGERSCLAVAVCRKGALVSDDLDARKAAIDLGVQISGTVGILIACLEKEMLDLSQADRLLAAMIEQGITLRRRSSKSFSRSMDLLAGLQEAQLRPIVFGAFQVPGAARQKHRGASMIDRHVGR